ncbi:hypothetical protein [Vreelandella titanicae]|uniref:Thioesterase domain-containing protein n=1 Tax=Vreelandella titanicae TaxID=664683 RepID=A0AAP9NS51_9GAMM|nr:hypothetical protein [Halomonas titanicae]QKS26768.1 hypothetical protein FX987_04584 [Halomonas titanicae]
MSEPISFVDFKPGEVMGSVSHTYSQELSDAWGEIFGEAASESSRRAEAAGVATVMMMRAYLEVVTPRPPGNIHARQQITTQGTPCLGELISNQISCTSKEVRRGRRYVELKAVGSGNGQRPIYTGHITLIWAT